MATNITTEGVFSAPAPQKGQTRFENFPMRLWPAWRIRQSSLFSLFCPHTLNTPWKTPHLTFDTSSHTLTHAKSALFSPPVSHPHSVMRDPCVVVPVYVPFSGVTFHRVCMLCMCVHATAVYCVCNCRCVYPCARVWGGAHALSLL